MVHVRFDTSRVTIQDLLAGQSGGGAITFFEGMPFQRGVQRGAGVGDVLRRLWRFVVPLASKAGQALAPLAKEIGREGLVAGSRVLSDVAEGGDVRSALSKEGRAGVRRLLKRAAAGADIQEGSGARKTKRRRLAGSNVILKPHALDGRSCSVALPKRRDALGAY
ncbi:hypothetical protein AAVH_30808 [Aphelenchoides avenae]|nr:hypothetical protein AAVH_30808 [Aphelenchus avenae]